MSVTKLREEMSIKDYLSLNHQNDRNKVLTELQQKVISGEITTEKQFEDFMHQDIRCNAIDPEIGKTFPLIHVIEDTSKEKMIIGDTEIPHYIVSVVWVMITK